MENPKIRFKGYTKDWEQRKLGELGTVQTCKRIFKDQTSEKGDIPFFKNGTIGLEPDSYISREMYEEFRRLYPYPEVGDTLISVVGSIGRTAEYTGKDEYFQDSNVVWLKTDGSINKKFLKISYQVIKWLIEGSTVKHLYNDNILRSEIIMPVSQIEQAKIAEFFEELDHLITLHQRKCEQTKKLKKYMLQKMFPQNGAKVPEIRFDGFTYDWEQRKVSEITKFHKQGFYTTEEYDNSKKYYLLRGTDLTENKLVLKDTPKIDATEKDYDAFKTEIGDFLIVRSGTVGTYGIVDVDIPAIFGSYLIDFRFDMEQVTNEFFGYFYQSSLFKSQLNKIIQASANTNINAENIKSTVISLPSLNEQRRISEYLGNLDNLITLHQRQHKLHLNMLL